MLQINSLCPIAVVMLAFPLLSSAQGLAPGAVEPIPEASHAAEMANAGARATPSPAMIRPVASLGEDFTRFDSRYAEPSAQRRGPMPSSPRIEASRLSTRLENPANSLLQSRLFDPRKGARHSAGQQNQGADLLER